VEAAARERILVEIPGTSGELDFRHRRIREFLAARALALQGARPDMALDRTLDSVEIEQMLILYAGMTRDPRDLVEDLLSNPEVGAIPGDPLRAAVRAQRRLVLAAKCLGAAQGKCDDLRARVETGLGRVLTSGNAAERVEAIDALQSVMPQNT